MFLLQAPKATDFDVNPLPWYLLLGLIAVMAVIRFTAPKFFFRYVWSMDHKMIGKQFLVSSLLWAILGGLLALGVRWQLAWPGSEVPIVHQWYGEEGWLGAQAMDPEEAAEALKGQPEAVAKLGANAFVVAAPTPERFDHAPLQGSTPAEDIGLQRGDVITAIKGTYNGPSGAKEFVWPVDSKGSFDSFRAMTEVPADVHGGDPKGWSAPPTRPGDTVTLEVYRGGSPMSLELEWGQQAQAMDGVGYNILVTMHASIMIFFVIIPILAGAFANFVVPLQIGAHDMAFPFLNALSYWLMWPAFIFMGCSFIVEGHGAGSGWTAYPPLSHLIDGDGQTYWCIGVWWVGWSSICGAINYITTIVKMRAPGLTFFRLPLTTWSIFITALLVLCATPVLGSAMVMLISDRTLGSSFFLPTARDLVNSVSDGGLPGLRGQGQGQVILWQHLFWFYSHPAVYIMVLPAMGMVSDMLSTAARKPIFGYRPMVYSMCAIAGLGFIVWGHHMFQAGMNPTLGRTFMIATMVIALPSAVKTFNWLGTIYKSRMQFQPHMVAALAFISMWIVGGLSGIFMAATPVDIQIHDTYAIVAHFHYVVFGATLFAVFGGIYYWFPKMFGRLMNKPVAMAHLFLTFIFFNITFFPMHVLGSRGMLRRTFDPYYYANLHGMLPVNQLMTWAAIGLGLSQLLLAYNFFGSMFRGKVCTDRNPWRANTLVWCTPTPPVDHGNFEAAPEVFRGAYEFSVPGRDEDYWPQFEAPEPEPTPAPTEEEEAPTAS